MDYLFKTFCSGRTFLIAGFSPEFCSPACHILQPEMPLNLLLSYIMSTSTGGTMSRRYCLPPVPIEPHGLNRFAAGRIPVPGSQNSYLLRAPPAPTCDKNAALSLLRVILFKLEQQFYNPQKLLLKWLHWPHRERSRVMTIYFGANNLRNSSLRRAEPNISGFFELGRMMCAWNI